MLCPANSHTCHVFRDTAEQTAEALAFVREGLENGEACMLIVGRQPVSDWHRKLQACGIDSLGKHVGGALTITDGASYRQPDRFNSMTKARELMRFISDHTDGFNGIRIIGDVAWEYEPPLPVDQLCHWEATVNVALAAQNVRTVCQYDLSSDSPQLVHAALRTHPYVYVDGALHSNPFNDAARILQYEPHLNQTTGDAGSVEQMLRTVKGLS